MSIRPADLLAHIESQQAPMIVDVRSREEYLAGHVPGAIHIPFWACGWRAGRVSREQRRHLSRGQPLAVPPSDRQSGAERPIVVYCGHGPRAWMAGTLLGLRGLRNLIYLEGHWTEWRRQGLREEIGDRPSSGGRE
jgi:rhodanese-related sulfurtransferase